MINKLIHFIQGKLLRSHYIYGDSRRVSIGENVSLVNTLINTASGDVKIGNNTIFGHNCMLLTGTHEFEGGVRKKLLDAYDKDTPSEGRDIVIGEGCWVSSGAIINGGVTIGDNSIIAAGAVVVKDVPSGVVVAGIPAKIIKKV